MKLKFVSVLVVLIVSLLASLTASAQQLVVGVNVSARGYNTPEHPVIVGFVVQQAGLFYLRSVGPELKQFGVPDAAEASPELQVFKGSELIWTYRAEMLGWGTVPNMFNNFFFAEGYAAQTVTGAMPMAPVGENIVSSRVLWLEPGAYTIMASSAKGTILLEAYAVPFVEFREAMYKSAGRGYFRDLTPPRLTPPPAKG